MNSASHFNGILHPKGPPHIERVDGGSPIVTSTAGSPTVAWHGEFFGLDEFAAELGLHGDAPIDQTLQAGWKRWQDGLFLRLDGVYTLALWTGDELVLHRERSGLRHVFYTIGDSGEFLFASDLDILLRDLGREPNLARTSLHEYLRFGDISAPRTPYDGIAALEPGQVLRIRPGSAPRVESSPAVVEQPASFDNLARAADRLEALLRKGIRERLKGARRPAAFLSGGIDSALICALAAQERPDLVAVTVGFDRPPFDETPVAARVAQHLGLSHRVLRYEQSDYAGALERLAQLSEQPIADPAALATLLAMEQCAESFDLILDGTGADESVGMMPPRHVRLATGFASLLPNGVRAALTSALRSVPGLSGYAAISDFEHPAETMIRWHGFTRREVEALCGETVTFAQTRFFRTFEAFSRHSHYDRYTALLNAMPCERLTQAMRSTPLPVRYPFWDRSTEAFIEGLLPDMKYSPDSPKRIFRELLARHVPAAIWDSPKHSFDFPLLDFLCADRHDVVRRHLDLGPWQRHGLLDATAVAGLAKRFIAGEHSLTFRVWALVVLDAWLQHHGTKGSPG